MSKEGRNQRLLYTPIFWPNSCKASAWNNALDSRHAWAEAGALWEIVKLNHSISRSFDMGPSRKILAFLKDNLQVIVRRSTGSPSNLWNVVVAQFVVSNSLLGPPISAFRRSSRRATKVIQHKMVWKIEWDKPSCAVKFTSNVPDTLGKSNWSFWNGDITAL